MKILVINKLLKEHHKEHIRKNASEIGGEVLFVESETDIPEDYKDCDIIYGFGMKNAAANKNLKWFAAPSAGLEGLPSFLHTAPPSRTTSPPSVTEA